LWKFADFDLKHLEKFQNLEETYFQIIGETPLKEIQIEMSKKVVPDDSKRTTRSQTKNPSKKSSPKTNSSPLDHKKRKTLEKRQIKIPHLIDEELISVGDIVVFGQIEGTITKNGIIEFQSEGKTISCETLTEFMNGVLKVKNRGAIPSSGWDRVICKKNGKKMVDLKDEYFETKEKRKKKKEGETKEKNEEIEETEETEDSDFE